MNTTYTQEEMIENLVATGNHTQASAEAALAFLATYTNDPSMIAAKRAIFKQATTPEWMQPGWMQPETMLELESELENSEFLQDYL